MKKQTKTALWIVGGLFAIGVIGSLGSIETEHDKSRALGDSLRAEALREADENKAAHIEQSQADYQAAQSGGNIQPVPVQRASACVEQFRDALESGRESLLANARMLDRFVDEGIDPAAFGMFSPQDARAQAAALTPQALEGVASTPRSVLAEQGIEMAASQLSSGLTFESLATAEMQATYPAVWAGITMAAQASYRAADAFALAADSCK